MHHIVIAECDSDKDAINRAKHRVPLLFGVRVFADRSHVVNASFRPIDGEDRLKAVGMIDGRLWTAVYVERGGAIRFISVRRSNPGEQGNYHRHSEGSE